MSASAHNTCLRAATRETFKRRLWGPFLFQRPSDRRQNLYLHGTEFTGCISFNSHHGRRTTILRDEDLRTIRTT